MNNKNNVLSEVIKKGRIAEWILSLGGISLCILGGLYGFLDGANIVEVILALVVAVFGIEAVTK